MEQINPTIQWFFELAGRIDKLIPRSGVVIHETFYQICIRSSCPEVLCKKGVLRNFTKLTGKHLCQRTFFNKVADSGTGVFLWILWNF